LSALGKCLSADMDFGSETCAIRHWVRLIWGMDQAQDLAEGRARIERQRAIIAQLEQLRIDSAKLETMRSRQAPVFLPAASDHRTNADIQAAAIAGAYGADHYHDDVPGPRWLGSLVVAMTVLALAVLATVGTFAYCVVFGGYVFPSLPPIVAGIEPDNIVWNNSDTRRNNSSQTSLTSAGSSEKLVSREQQPIDIREATKTVPRVISAIPIASKPPLNTAGSAAVAPPAPAATAPALDPPVPSTLAPHVASSVPPPASAPVPVPVSSEPKETAAVVPLATAPAVDTPVLAEGSVSAPGSAPVPVPASSEPNETAAVAPLATAPAVATPVLAEGSVSAPGSAPVPVPASLEPKNIHTVIVGPAGWEETDTSSPSALAPHSATSAAERPSAVAAPPVANRDAEGDAAPSRSHMRAGTGTAGEAYSVGAYAVQVASERSAAAAHATFRALRAKFPNQLGGREPIVRRAYLDARGIYYRAMIGPFASMERAAGMCSTLKAAGGNCLVQRK
jgi:SPOR domain